jgi:peptidoglycan/xylan/chitin deacetylase (PgdA/CDA1 family)
VIAVSSLLRRAVYPAMSRAGIFSRRVRAGEVCVLTYHGVLPEGWAAIQSPTEGTLVSAEQFRRHLRFLKSRYNLISPEAFHSWLKAGDSLPQRAVLLTCDDGLRNVLTDMVPILLEEGARCIFFVTGVSLADTAECLWYEELYHMLNDAPGDALVAVGGKAVRKDLRTSKDLVGIWWSLVQELSVLNGDERKRSLRSLRTDWRLPDDWRMVDDDRAAKRYQLLSYRELNQLVTQGMTMGAHTLSHPLLPKMSAELAEQEIRGCKERLEAQLQQEVWALAYPFGHEGSAGAREMTLAERAGYACAFLNHGGGLLGRTGPRFGLPRAHVTANMNMSEFEAHLSGFHEALQRRFRSGGSSSCV